MKKYLAPEVVDSLNNLLARMFKANSESDNRAYALHVDFDCHKASEIYHENIAHWFTGDDMADKISEIMYKFNARPVRKGFEGDTKDYGSIVEIFQESLDTIEEIMSMISNLIEVLDYNTENKLLVIELEDVLEDMLDKRDISNTWLEKAKIYTEKDKLYAFDKDFDKFV